MKKGVASLIRIIGYCFGLSALAVCGLFLLFLCTGGVDYTIRLPHGYALVQVSAHNVALVDKDGREIVPPNVDSYGVAQDLVAGRTSGQGSEGPQGFFVVDTSSGAAVKGLSEHQLRAFFQKRGLRGTPALHRPSRLSILW